MARAMVELVGSASYTINGRKFVKDAPQLLTDPDEILFFQNRPGFKVVIEQELPKAKKEKKASLKKLDQELTEIVGGAKPKPKKVKVEKEEPVKEEVEKYTKEVLLSYKKTELAKMADDMGIVFDGPVKRLKIIEAILQKQEG